jgi:transcriptional regulator with XRE-family HTH domain
MGGIRSGRRPDLERRARAVALRAQGLTLKEVGYELGISRQAAGQLLRATGASPLGVILCAGCGAGVAWPTLRGRLPSTVLCRACVEQSPGATFGQRLRAYRLAAGLNPAALAKQARVREKSIGEYERDQAKPSRKELARLVRVLGAGLVAGAPSRGRARRGRAGPARQAGPTRARRATG